MRYGVWAGIPQKVGPWYHRVQKWGPRYGVPSRAIVTHRMDGSLESSDDWLRRTASGPASAHFGIGRWDGWPQVRQWVDTTEAAWTWAASPTDRPTAVGFQVFGDLLYPKSGWPPYGSRADLNRYVTTIEVEGWWDKPWDPELIPLYNRLVAAIVAVHGPQYMCGHGDLSTKPCPGFVQWQRAVPNVYGKRLGSVPKPPVPSPTPTGVDVTLSKVTIPGDAGRLFDVKAGVTLWANESHTKVHFKTTTPMQYKLLGFHDNGDVLASNPKNPGGNPFLVPPVH